MKRLLTLFMLIILLASVNVTLAQTTVTIGTGTSTSYFYGPIYRSSAGSAFDYSKYDFLFTATELAAAGITSGVTITQLAWNKFDAFATTGNAKFDIYLKNSALTTLPASVTWSNVTTGATLAYTTTAQTIPAPAGWIVFNLTTPLIYSGGAIEIATDWDISAVAGNPATGAFNWYYTSALAFNGTIGWANSTVGSGTSSLATGSYGGTLRPNIQITYTGGATCSGVPAPGNTVASSNPVCSGVSFSLSLQNPTPGSGVTYVWETSPDNAGWLPAGATSAAYGTTQTTATYYRCQVTCAGNTTISTPVYVTMNPFMNCYCSAIPSFTADEEIYSVTVNGATNAYNCTTVAPGSGSILNRYSNFFPLGSLTSMGQGGAYNFTIEENECDGATFYSNGCAIWIDFNQNGSFADAGEQVFVEATTTTGPRTITGSIVVPATATLGQTAMRIIVAENYFGAGLTPCMVYAYGETEDYLVTIALPPACPQPASLTATGINGFQATLDWTEIGTATEWELEWGAAGFTPGTGTLITTATGLTKPYVLTGLIPSTNYSFYVRSKCSASSFSNWTGPKLFSTTVACPAPTLLGATPATTSASLFWTSPGTLFKIEWMLATATPTGTANITGIANPYTLTPLVPATTYKYYVQQDCGVNGVSLWAGPFTFTTLCVTLTPTYIQDFQGTFLPPCWSVSTGQLAAPTTMTGTFSNWIQGDWQNVVTGDKAAKLNIWSTGLYSWLKTPSIDLGTGSPAYQLEFDLSLNAYATSTPPATTGVDDKFAVVISTDGGTTWTSANTLRLWDNAGSPYVYNNINYLGERIILPLAGYTGTVMIGFYGESTVSNADNDLMINNVVVGLVPSCTQPNALFVDNISETGAFLHWTETGTATTWDVEWGPAGFVLGTGTAVAGTSNNPYKLIGVLTPSTNYAYYVRANCPGGGNSSWSGPQPFTTAGIPNCATAVSPLNGAVNVLSTASLNWASGGGAPTGYKLYFGRTSPPAYIGDLGLVTTYTPLVPMDWLTPYYWKVIPYSASGDATGCSEWTFTTAPITYCTSGATNAADEEIYSVTVNGVTNAYNCTTVAPGPGSILNRYSNFTTLGPVFSLPQGSTASFTVEENECDGAAFYSFGTAIWVDFDQNGLFTDAGEQVFVESVTAAGPRNVTGTFAVPAGATTGTTRMRVTIAEGLSGAALTPCLSYGYGETEDYTVTIAPPPDHDAGTLSIDDVPSSILVGTTITPKATVKNFGTNPEVFNVQMTITGGYTSTVTGVALAAGASTQVTFSTWTPPVGAYTVQACTQLVGDMVPGNDCKSKAASVSAAAWTSGTVFPDGTYMGTGVGYTDNSVSPPVGWLYSFGGNTNSALGTESYKYNVNTDTWSAIAPLPAKRVVVASAQSGNYIYIIGGSDGVAYFNTVYRYDIAANTYTTLTSTLPKTIAWGKAVAYGSNYIYLAGGVDAFTSGVVIPDVYLYNVALDTWTAATSMPGAKFGGAFSRTGDKLVYVAGADLAVISNTVYVGTISANPLVIAWATAKSAYPGTTGEPVSVNTDPTASSVPNETIQVVQGDASYPAGAMYRFDGAPWGTDGIIVAAGSPSTAWTPAVPNPCYVYKPATDTWAQQPDVPIAVLGASTGSVDLNNAGTHTWKLIVASGYTGSVVTTATQILTETFAPAVPANYTASETVTSGIHCYNATNTLTVTNYYASGVGTSVEFIAGQKVSFMPPVLINGSAQMWAHITTTSNYCSPTDAPMVAATGQEEPVIVLNKASFSLYPNPTNGNFTLVQKGEKTYGNVTVEVYNISGSKVMTERMIGEQKHEFNFSCISAGIFFVKIVAEDYVETIKLVKTR